MRISALKIGLIAVLSATTIGCGPGWRIDGKQAQSDDAEETPDEPALPPKDSAQPGTKLEDLPEGNAALTNLPEIIKRLNLAGYYARGYRGQGLKIAVLDNGFTGLTHSLGVRLPPDTQLAKAPRAEMQNTTHGTKMAEIAYAVATGSAAFSTAISGPEIRLYNTNGYTNFADAVAQVIADKVDIVIYSQVWEYGGNLDGGGFINRLVSKATAAGVLWINAAGNYGETSFSSPIEVSGAGTVTLPHNDQFVRFTVPQNATPVKIVLAWNDFDDSKDYMTSQDLDLTLEDATGTVIAKADLIQDGKTDPTSDAKHSAHAREIINSVLRTGSYRLRVTAKSSNFTPDSHLRLTVDGHGVKFLDAEKAHTVLIPGDNPEVLTIGASDVTTSGRIINDAGELTKPELAVVSQVSFANGEQYRGTSAAAAIAAGAMAVFRTAYGEMPRQELGNLINIGSFGKKDASCKDATKCLPAPVLSLPAW